MSLASNEPQIDSERARLREIQQRARALESEIEHRKELEVALRAALQARRVAAEELRACVQREKEARERAEASDAFKELFLGILGHDLRNPLSAILMTARLMAMRGDLGADMQKKLGRMVSSGVRMQRMIEQLLDVACARLADGIPVRPRAHQDLAPVVAKLIDELREAHPGRRIELRSEGACAARVDLDRVEQVVSNLLENAIKHGDPAQAITVTLAPRGEGVSVRVHNSGPPIDPTFMPLLFDPFKRGETTKGHTDGLGLGLYIAERIVRAHGGTIEVESSAETGTCFEAVFPGG